MLSQHDMNSIDWQVPMLRDTEHLCQLMFFVPCHDAKARKLAIISGGQDQDTIWIPSQSLP